jgi:hypothetical protein
MGDSPFLNKAILPHPIHVLCLDFSIWSTIQDLLITDCTSAVNTGPEQGLIKCGHTGLPSARGSQMDSSSSYAWIIVIHMEK